MKVLVGGVFNIIHPGHIYFLKEAKKFGDYLIVVIATDKTAGKKVIYPAELRKKMVESLDFVDKEVVGNDINKMDIVRREKPDVIVLGYDQKMDIEGIPVKRIGRFKDFSTGKIMKRIKAKRKN